MSTTTVDVLIVGGGPAGALVAHGLAQQGLQVLVIKAIDSSQATTSSRASPPNKPCGEFLAARGVAVLGRRGLLPRILPWGQRLHHLTLASARGAMSADFPTPALGIRRSDLDRILLAAAAEQAEVWLGRRVSHVSRPADPTGPWRVQLSDRSIVEAAMLIGADGRHSSIRQETGLGRSLVHTGRHALVVHARGVRDCAGGEMHLGGYGQIGLCPLPPSPPRYDVAAADGGGTDEANINLLLSPRGSAQLGRMGTADLLRAGIAATPTLAHRLRRATFLDSVTAVAHLRQQPWRVSGHRIALVGDAALCSDPFTGDGMSNALEDAELLVACMAHWPGALRTHALNAYGQAHHQIRRRQRIETLALPAVLDRFRLGTAIVAGLAHAGLGSSIIGRRHRRLDVHPLVAAHPASPLDRINQRLVSTAP